MEWVTGWQYLPVDYGACIGRAENLVQRTVFRNNLYGDAVRLHFSNRFGREPLVLERMRFVVRDDRGRISGPQPVTFGGQEKLTLQPGQERESDELPCAVCPGQELVLDICIKGPVGIWSAVSTSFAGLWRSVFRTDWEDGETLADEDGWTGTGKVFPSTGADDGGSIAVGIAGIRIRTDRRVRTITAFGDSITHMGAFTNALYARCAEEFPGTCTVLNAGLGGNRLLHGASPLAEDPGNGSCFGEAGLTRFERDVYGAANPDIVLLLEGVNDIMHPWDLHLAEEPVTAQELAGGAGQLVQAAHRRGSRVCVGTVLPFYSERIDAWFEEAEPIRKEYNDWVRTQSGADAVVDFDAAMKSAADPRRMGEGLDIGDGLHPNPAGGRIMAEAAMEVLRPWLSETEETVQ